MISDPKWFIKVREAVYGPYTPERMQVFATEGRLSARSQVSMDEGGEFFAASDDETLAVYFTHSNAGTTNFTAPSPSRRFVIFAKVTDESRSAFVDVLSGFGVAIEAMSNVWLLTAPAHADTLRNAMSQVLGHDDVLFIADASKGNSAWFNIGQDADGRIRQFWQDSE